MRTSWGKGFQEYSGQGITLLVDCSNVGATAIFNEKRLRDPHFICAGLTFLPSLIFIGALTSLLFYLRILPCLIHLSAKLMTRLLGISGAESLITISNVFLGMVEAPLAIRPYLKQFRRSEIFCMMTTGMATIAGGVLVVYGGLPFIRFFSHFDCKNNSS